MWAAICFPLGCEEKHEGKEERTDCGAGLNSPGELGIAWEICNEFKTSAGLSEGEGHESQHRGNTSDSTHGMGETGIKLPDLWLVDDPLYLLSHSHPTNDPTNEA
ncbi:unnamed protein product [Pleuronectes platessa]|uniref:Uncharacterized protein n=1 Tax=Pleuronectes platessa TaxID=8262 RepID=A0A9N7TYD6_PLEPL|nr:unnamed protein product [Pleuronectes platessa]